MLCLSSDCNSHREDQSNSNCSPTPRTPVVVASTNCHSDNFPDDDCFLLVKENILNVDVMAARFEELQSEKVQIKETISETGSTTNMKANDLDSFACGCSPSAANMSKN